MEEKDRIEVAGVTKNISAESELKGIYRIKQEVFWTAGPAVVAASFFLGLYFGTSKFDKEKLEYYNQNIELNKKITQIRDSIRNAASIKHPSK